MDPANRLEARREAEADIREGADMLMVKPALPYLDVLRDLRERYDLPLAAYQVSGEYAMLHAAGQRGWLDLPAAAVETVTAIKRAGADLIITYFAETLARHLGQPR
jgi:porphobilinogen synthase